MRVLVYEFITGGGLAAHGDEPLSGSLFREGLAMVEALAGDFADLPGCEVDVLCDYRLDLSIRECRSHRVVNAAEEQTLLRRLAAAADWTVVIAPEFNSQLSERCRWVLGEGGRLLGPGLQTVELASDKHLCCEHLRHRGVPVPQGVALEPGQPLPSDFDYPAVLKPRDGAGSLNVQQIDSKAAAKAFGAVTFAARLEVLVEGAPASVSCLCGPEKIHTMPVCLQDISSDGRFAYRGGSVLFDDEMTRRAQRLASEAVETLPEVLGYVGVDLVLGENEAEDVVLEVNPRLTTSYVGLRAAAEFNLAGAILEIALGHDPELSFLAVPLEFDASGMVLQLRGGER